MSTWGRRASGCLAGATRTNRVVEEWVYSDSGWPDFGDAGVSVGEDGVDIPDQELRQAVRWLVVEQGELRVGVKAPDR